ncbi:MAG TPA: hypothetical protein VNJ08_14400 [Bacteriovoracaceae bacterium]|nr:hypothetical protein [Bacteriovoracaceae bacterium]
MEKFIISDAKTGRLILPNPTNRDENFADKWDEEKYPNRKNEFFKWLARAKEDFLDLSSKPGFLQISEGLKKSLGDKEVVAAFEKYAKGTRSKREGGKLKMNLATGVLGTTSGVGVKAHTFFGDDD